MAGDRLRRLFLRLRPAAPCLVVPQQKDTTGGTYHVDLWQPEQTLTMAETPVSPDPETGR